MALPLQSNSAKILNVYTEGKMKRVCGILLAVMFGVAFIYCQKTA
jgi:hypothetical protein